MFTWFNKLRNKTTCGSCRHFSDEYEEYIDYNIVNKIPPWCRKLHRFVSKSSFTCNGEYYEPGKHDDYYYPDGTPKSHKN